VPDGIFFLTSDCDIFRSTDSGSSFAQVNGLAGPYVNSTATSGNKVFIASNGDSCRVYLTTDNGIGWTPVGLPAKAIISDLTVIGNSLLTAVFLSQNWGSCGILRRPVSEMVGETNAKLQ
jgi:hypothetical protein